MESAVERVSGLGFSLMLRIKHDPSTLQRGFCGFLEYEGPAGINNMQRGLMRHFDLFQERSISRVWIPKQLMSC